MIGFTLSYDVTVDLTVAEMWPDGDAPENPTVEDVQTLIKNSGGVERVLHDWNLIDYGDKFYVMRWERELRAGGGQ